MNKTKLTLLKKPLNFRLPLFIAVCLIIGVALAAESVVITAVIFGVTMITVFILYLFSKNKKIIFVCVLGAIFFICGYATTFRAFNSSGKINFYEVEVCARITSNDGKSIVFDDLIVDGDAYKGKMQLWLNFINKEPINKMLSELNPDEVMSIEDLQTGKTIVFFADAEEILLTPDPKIISQYQKNIRFNITKLRNIHEVCEGELKFNEKILISFDKVMKNNLKPDTYGMLSAVLFGDKSNIENDLLDDFKTNGLIHLFAVSGLHVGIVSTLVLFLLKLVKTPRKLKYIITSIAIIFYAYICGFTPSVTRATVMLLTYFLTRLLLAPPDTLSSLSYAAIIILIIKPLSLFGMSFAMSFIAVFAILTAGNSFTFMFRYLPRKISSLLSISLAVNILLLPVFLYSFKGYSVIYILANMIFIPLMPFVFSVGFILLFVALIPGCSQILSVMDIICKPIIWLNGKFAELPFAYVETPNLSPFIALFIGVAVYTLAVISSKYVFTDKRLKKLYAAILLGGYIIFFISTAAVTASYPHTISNKNYSDIYVINTGTEQYAVSLLPYDEAAERKLKYLECNTNITKFDKIFLCGVSEEYRDKFNVNSGKYHIIEDFSFCDFGSFSMSFYQKHTAIICGKELIIIPRPDLNKYNILTNELLVQLYNGFYGADFDTVTMITDFDNLEKYVNLPPNASIVKRNLNNFTLQIKNGRIRI